MKIIGINTTGSTRETLYIGNDSASRQVYDTSIRNEYTLTIEEETPLKYTAKNKIELPSNLVDELDAFMEEFAVKCKKEYIAMQGLLY